MTFTGMLKKLIAKVPTMTNAELVAANNVLTKTSVVLYMGAPDRVLNLCNEALDAIGAEMKRRPKRRRPGAWRRRRTANDE